MKTSYRVKAFIMGLSTSVALVAPLHQAHSQVPSAAEPEVIGREYKRETRPSVSRTPVIQFKDDAGAMIANDSTKFRVDRITIEGSDAIPEAKLADIFEKYEGTEITLGTLRQIANEVTNRYRNEGYILTRAIVPAQKLTGKGAQRTAVIRVVEGFINEVKFAGDIKGPQSLLDAYAAKIKKFKPLTAEALERYLLLADDLPGATARGVLQPSTTVPGASDLIVTIEHDTWENAAFFNNRGSRYLGQYQAGIVTAANSVMGMYERTQFRGIITPFEPEELQYGELSHEQQIGTEGTRVLASISYTGTEPGSSLKDDDIEGESIAATLGVRHPFIRSRQRNLFGDFDFTYRNSSTDFGSPSTELYDDRLRVVRAGLDYDFVDSLKGVNSVSANVHEGLDILDSSEGEVDRSRTNGETSFTKSTLELTRLQQVYGPFSVYGAVSGQYSSSPLLASEEFGIGGSSYGRAFDPAEITGDDGIASKIEVRYNDAPGMRFLDSYQLYAFYDIGKVWNRETIASEFKDASAASAGVGSRFNITESLTGGVELAVPLTRDVAANGNDGDDPRVFFSLLARF